MAMGYNNPFLLATMAIALFVIKASSQTFFSSPDKTTWFDAKKVKISEY